LVVLVVELERLVVLITVLLEQEQVDKVMRVELLYIQGQLMVAVAVEVHQQ
jgi:hypothetical protein